MAQAMTPKEEAKYEVQSKVIKDLLDASVECSKTQDPKDPPGTNSGACLIFYEKVRSIPLDYLVPGLPSNLKLSPAEETTLRYQTFSNLRVAWLHGRQGGIWDTVRMCSKNNSTEKKGPKERAPKRD